jgi:hypothetical protein
MFPKAYALPIEILLVLSGALACFAGYRMFRLVLAIYGFVFGAMIASSTMGISGTLWILIAALLGGIVGAVVLVFAYFVGIALVGAGLGALLAHFAWGYLRAGDPPAVGIIGLAILGAIAATLLQRYVMILSTAFGGAWTMIIGGLALAGNRAVAQAATSGDVWVLYPLTPAHGQSWVPIAWVVLGLVGLVGTFVQWTITGRR